MKKSILVFGPFRDTAPSPSAPLPLSPLLPGGLTSPSAPTAPSPEARGGKTPAPADETTEPSATPRSRPTSSPVVLPTPALTTPTTEQAAEPTPSPSTAPVTPAPVGEEVEAEYLGCYHDNRADRVLGDVFDSPDMTTRVEEEKTGAERRTRRFSTHTHFRACSRVCVRASNAHWVSSRPLDGK